MFLFLQKSVRLEMDKGQRDRRVREKKNKKDGTILEPNNLRTRHSLKEFQFNLEFPF